MSDPNWPILQMSSSKEIQQRWETLSTSLGKGSTTKEIRPLIIALKEEGQLADCILEDVERVSKRGEKALWGLGHAVKEGFRLQKKQVEKLVGLLEQCDHASYRREMAGIMRFHMKGNEDRAVLYDMAVKSVGSDEPVAVKVHFIRIVSQMVKVYPQLKEEFLLLLREQEARNSVAFSACIRQQFPESNNLGI